VGAGLVGLALLLAPQERLVWQPPGRRRWGRAPNAGRIDYVAADGQPLFAWVVAPDRAPAGTLLAFHGNAELAAWSVPWAREVARRTGWAVVLPEYRGYAGLGGASSYEGARLDAEAALAAARGSGLGAPLALYGHSLGSAVAAELAEALDTAGSPPATLLLESPFTSVRAMARLGHSALLDRLWERVARVRFETAARVASLRAPVAVAHGLVDLVVPARMGIAVHGAAMHPGPLLLLPTAGHNDVVERGGARYWRWLAAALAAGARAEHLVR
jgi:hypothetical protein